MQNTDAYTCAIVRYERMQSDMGVCVRNKYFQSPSAKHGVEFRTSALQFAVAAVSGRRVGDGFV